MEVELEGFFGLDRSPGYWEDCELKYTGIGREQVDQTFDSIEFNPAMDGLLSVGFAGSVNTDFEPGELCLIESIKSEGKEDRLQPDEALWARAKKSLTGDYQTCELLTVDRTLRSTEEKLSLYSKQFSIIDRETYWVAKIAEEEALPFLSLRVVFDGIDQELPPEFCYDGDTGKVKPGSFTSWLVRNPSRLKEIPRLGWNSVKARRRLGQALNELVPALLG